MGHNRTNDTEHCRGSSNFLSLTVRRAIEAWADSVAGLGVRAPTITADYLVGVFH